jgi:hypothetical protein
MYLAGGFPDGIPRRVAAPTVTTTGTDIAVNLVHLDAQRIGVKLERSTLIIVGVQGNPDVVIVPRRIPIAQVSSNGLGIGVFRVEGDVQIFTILNQERRRSYRGGLILSRTRFDTKIDPDGTLPLTILENAVYLDLTLEARQI